MNKLMVIGRLGKDAQIKESANNGSRFCVFTMADTQKVKGADVTQWYDVTCFNVDRISHILPYLKKGTAVVVNGPIVVSNWVGNDGQTHTRISLTADSIDFTGIGGASGQTQTTVVQETTVSPTTTSSDIGDDIPMKKQTKKKVAVVEPVVSTVSSSDDDLPF